MNRSVEQIALDEKIARIRKQNEEIIRRKQIIDEEIQSAKRNNAVVNVKKTYHDELDCEPSLYSDSFVTQQQKTVTYPKMRVAQMHQNNRQRNKHEEMAWRREREEIDNERIRRQKAASGWRREWDADKTLENQREPDVDRNQRDLAFRSRGSRLSANDDHDKSTLLQYGRGPRTDAHSSRDVKRDVSLRLLSRKPSENDGSDLKHMPTTAYRTRERNFNDINDNAPSYKNGKSGTLNELRSTEAKHGENEIGKPLNRFERNITESKNEPAKCWPTSGPLNMKRTILVKNDDKQDVVITRITKYSETRTLPRNDSSKIDESITEDLSKSLKNIVIHVKNDDKREIQRVVELTDEPSAKAEPTDSKDKASGNVALLGTKSSGFSDTSSKDSPLTFNFKGSSPRQYNVFSFGDAGQSLGCVTSTTEVVNDDGNDDEWEDVSDEEWVDVSD